LMLRVMGYFERRFTTPNILTEVDNLTRQLPEEEHQLAAAALSHIISTLFEVYVPSGNTAQHAIYADLGLTDCVTLVAADDVLVVTDDFHLSNMLTSLGRDAVNINHIRNLNWS